MKYLYLLLSIFFATLLILSCTSSRTENVICDNGSLLLYPTGFDSTDFAAVITLRYKKDNTFDSLVDTVATSYEASVKDTGYLNMQDPTFSQRMNITDEAGIIAGYDYKIVLPVIGKTYLITNIAQSGETQHAFTYNPGITAPNGPPQCFNNIVSVKINDVIYPCAQNLEYSTARIFLPK